MHNGPLTLTEYQHDVPVSTPKRHHFTLCTNSPVTIVRTLGQQYFWIIARGKEGGGARTLQIAGIRANSDESCSTWLDERELLLNTEQRLE